MDDKKESCLSIFVYSVLIDFFNFLCTSMSAASQQMIAMKVVFHFMCVSI